MANSVDSNGSVNNNIYFSMREAQPGENAIGGSGGRKMRLIISDTDTNQTSKVSSDSNDHLVSSKARTIDVAAVLLNDASFLDKAKEFLGKSKRVKLNIHGQEQFVLLNTSSLAKRLGIVYTKGLTEKEIKDQASYKFNPRLTEQEAKRALKILQDVFSESQLTQQEKPGNSVTAAASVKSNPISKNTNAIDVLSNDVNELAEKIKKPDSLWKRMKGLFQKPPPPTDI